MLLTVKCGFWKVEGYCSNSKASHEHLHSTFQAQQMTLQAMTISQEQQRLQRERSPDSSRPKRVSSRRSPEPSRPRRESPQRKSPEPSQSRQASALPSQPVPAPKPKKVNSSSTEAPVPDLQESPPPPSAPVLCLISTANSLSSSVFVASFLGDVRGENKQESLNLAAEAWQVIFPWIYFCVLYIRYMSIPPFCQGAEGGTCPILKDLCKHPSCLSRDLNLWSPCSKSNIRMLLKYFFKPLAIHAILYSLMKLTILPAWVTVCWKREGGERVLHVDAMHTFPLVIHPCPKYYSITKNNNILPALLLIMCCQTEKYLEISEVLWFDFITCITHQSVISVKCDGLERETWTLQEGCHLLNTTMA